MKEDVPQTRKPAIRVFLALENREMRRMLAIALRSDGHFVLEASDGTALLMDLGHVFRGYDREASASVVVADLRTPGVDGLSILRRLREQLWCPPFIFLSDSGERTLGSEARGLGAHALFERPFDLQVLRAKVGNVRRSSGKSRALGV